MEKISLTTVKTLDEIKVLISAKLIQYFHKTHILPCMKRIMAPIEQKRNLAGNYSIPDSLNKELQKEFAEDVSTPMDKLQDDIINQNNYNKKRFQRSIVLDLDEQKVINKS